MLSQSITPCLIYCRVSSAKQMSEGDGLQSQEKRCRDYAAAKGYHLVGVFRESITGAADSRPEMNRLLDTLASLPVETVVIIDDIKRFARDVQVHFDLKSEIVKRGGRLESPQFRFEETPEGRFIETIIAAQAELERNQNRRQVVNRMKARMEQGFWTFNPIPGYKYVRDSVYKKVLALEATTAPLVKEALEGFAGDRFHSATEVCRFLASTGFFGVSPRKKPKAQLTQVDRMLRHFLYTGHLEHKAWGISLRPAYHPALISLEAFQLIQDKLNGQTKTFARQDVREEFPLRGFVRCAHCEGRLTACFSQGKYQRYPYYFCFNPHCEYYRKSIPKATLEETFEAYLGSLTTTPEIGEWIGMVAEHFWTTLQEREMRKQEEMRQHLLEIEDDLTQTGEKLSATSSEAVSRALEKRIERLDAERVRLTDKLQHYAPLHSEHLADGVRTPVSAIRHILENPLQVWKNDKLEERRTLLKLMHTEELKYERQGGFRTPNLSLPYRIYQELKHTDIKMVDPAGTIPNLPGLDQPEQQAVWAEFWGTIERWSKLPEFKALCEGTV